MKSKVEKQLLALEEYILKNDYKGWEPNDLGNSRLPIHRISKIIQIILVQIQLRSPINFRRILRVPKVVNPKTLGLMLKSYCLLYKINKNEKYKILSFEVIKKLQSCSMKSKSGIAWSYPIRWVGLKKTVNPDIPNVVTTSYVANGLFEYYCLFKDDEIKCMLEDICNYYLMELPVTEKEYGICFSYTPIKKDCCYNASALVAEILYKTFTVTGNENYKTQSLKAFSFIFKHQMGNGAWMYSIDFESNTERNQIDFHQGYILDSIYSCRNLSKKLFDKHYFSGLSFYKEYQFLKNGKSLWRLPKKYPSETHHQAQGVITFSKAAELDMLHLAKAEKVLSWAMDNLLDESKGIFYFRKSRFFTNRISYIRWSQAFMYNAMAEYLYSNYCITKNNNI